MSTPAQLAGRKRLVHQLDTPFSTTSWPEVSPDDQDTILELLCNLLSPIGQHRRAHIKPSKGKRSAKRDKKAMAQSTEPELITKIPAPPKPELSTSIDVGFSSITRNLEALSASCHKSSLSETNASNKTYSMVFVARGNQSPTFNCHFPQMIGVASKNLVAHDKIRLVGFSNPCSERLGSTLGLSRVSSVAIARNAPGADALLAFVQKNVAPVDIPWFEGDQRVEYRTTQINSVETTVGPKRLKQV